MTYLKEQSNLKHRVYYTRILSEAKTFANIFSGTVMVYTPDSWRVII